MTSNSPGIVEGLAACWAPRVDRDGAVVEIERGAFAAAIHGGVDVIAVLHGRLDYPLGRIANGTLLLTETADGLWFMLRLPDTTRGWEVAALVGRGDITGATYGGRCRSRVDARNRRIIERVDLVLLSIVTTPDHPGAWCRLAAADADEPNRLREMLRASRTRGGRG